MCTDRPVIEQAIKRTVRPSCMHCPHSAWLTADNISSTGTACEIILFALVTICMLTGSCKTRIQACVLGRVCLHHAHALLPKHASVIFSHRSQEGCKNENLDDVTNRTPLPHLFSPMSSAGNRIESSCRHSLYDYTPPAEAFGEGHVDHANRTS